MNKLKNFAGFLTVALLLVSSVANAYASQDENILDQETYSEIIESLSDEYGLEIKAGKPEGLSESEIATLSSGETDEELTPEEFESFLRNELEKITENNERVEDKLAEIGVDIDDLEWHTCGSNDSVARMRSYFVEKQYDGLNDEEVDAYLEGIIDDGDGYWRFIQVDDSGAEWMSLTGVYKSKTYSERFLDSGRTCAVTYDGYIYYTYGNITVYDVEEYVEFYASEGL